MRRHNAVPMIPGQKIGCRLSNGNLTVFRVVEVADKQSLGRIDIMLTDEQTCCRHNPMARINFRPAWWPPYPANCGELTRAEEAQLMATTLGLLAVNSALLVRKAWRRARAHA